MENSNFDGNCNTSMQSTKIMDNSRTNYYRISGGGNTATPAPQQFNVAPSRSSPIGSNPGTTQ
jgi:hypothetical protein